jgi:hypothetical protein
VSNTQELAIILSVTLLLLGLLLCALYHLRAGLGRFLTAFWAGVVTFYLILIALTATADSFSGPNYLWVMREYYAGVFGLRDRIAGLSDLPHWSETDEFYGPHGRAIANTVEIGFWTILFGTPSS